MEYSDRIADMKRIQRMLKDCGDRPKRVGLPGVYLVRCLGSDFYKIGLTRNINRRLTTIQTGCPHEVRVELFYKTSKPEEFEAEMHSFLADYRVRGEWFELTGGALEWTRDKLNGIMPAVINSNGGNLWTNQSRLNGS